MSSCSATEAANRMAQEPSGIWAGLRRRLVRHAWRCGATSHDEALSAAWSAVVACAGRWNAGGGCSQSTFLWAYAPHLIPVEMSLPRLNRARRPIEILTPEVEHTVAAPEEDRDAVELARSLIGGLRRFSCREAAVATLRAHGHSASSIAHQAGLSVSMVHRLHQSGLRRMRRALAASVTV